MWSLIHSLHTTYFPVQLAAGGVLQPPLVCSDQQYEAGLNECAQSAPHRSCLQTVHGGLCLLYHKVFAATIPKKHGPSPISTAWAPCGHVKWDDKYPINRRTESCWLQPPGLDAAASRVSEREREAVIGVYTGSHHPLTAGHVGSPSNRHTLPSLYSLLARKTARVYPKVACKSWSNRSTPCQHLKLNIRIKLGITFWPLFSWCLVRWMWAWCTKLHLPDRYLKTPNFCAHCSVYPRRRALFVSASLSLSLSDVCEWAPTTPPPPPGCLHKPHRHHPAAVHPFLSLSLSLAFSLTLTYSNLIKRHLVDHNSYVNEFSVHTFTRLKSRAIYHRYVWLTKATLITAFIPDFNYR